MPACAFAEHKWRPCIALLSLVILPPSPLRSSRQVLVAKDSLPCACDGDDVADLLLKVERRLCRHLHRSVRYVGVQEDSWLAGSALACKCALVPKRAPISPRFAAQDRDACLRCSSRGTEHLAAASLCRSRRHGRRGGERRSEHGAARELPGGGRDGRRT